MIKNLFLGLLFCVSASMVAQDPEFPGRPYLWHNKVALSDLERADAHLDVKTKAMGYGGVDLLFTLFTERSTERINKKNLPTFVIRVPKDVDPSEYYTIVKAQIRNKKRSFIISGYTMTGNTKDTSDQYVIAKYRRIKDDVYEVVLPDTIEPGEYGFFGSANSATQIGMRIKVSCFGVD